MSTYDTQDEAILQAAMNAAVAEGLLPKVAIEEDYLKNWKAMQAVVKAATDPVKADLEEWKTSLYRSSAREHGLRAENTELRAALAAREEQIAEALRLLANWRAIIKEIHWPVIDSIASELAPPAAPVMPAARPALEEE